jgi:hypothetical protein
MMMNTAESKLKKTIAERLMSGDTSSPSLRTYPRFNYSKHAFAQLLKQQDQDRVEEELNLEEMRQRMLEDHSKTLMIDKTITLTEPENIENNRLNLAVS